MQRSPPVHRRGSGACPDTRRSNKPCATTISTHSAFPDSSSPPKLNPVEPPWYGPVCPVVGEGWHREVSPYPDQRTLSHISCMKGTPCPGSDPWCGRALRLRPVVSPLVAHALKPSCPPLDHSLKLREAIGQGCRARLQDQRRFDFIHSLVLNGRSSIEGRPRHHPLRPELFPAPGADDQIGLPRDHFLGRHNTVLGCALI